MVVSHILVWHCALLYCPPYCTPMMIKHIFRVRLWQWAQSPCHCVQNDVSEVACFAHYTSLFGTRHSCAACTPVLCMPFCILFTYPCCTGLYINPKSCQSMQTRMQPWPTAPESLNGSSTKTHAGPNPSPKPNLPSL